MRNTSVAFKVDATPAEEKVEVPMSDTMNHGTVYEAMRRDMHEISERIWRVRTWATALVAAAVTAVVGANFYGRLALNLDPVVFSGLVLFVGALGNFALWHLSLESDRSILRVACYVWWIEHKAGWDHGWEHWAFYRSVKFPGTMFARVAWDVQTWLAMAYVIMLGYFWGITNVLNSWLLLGFLVVSLLLFIVGVIRRALGHNARRRFLRELLMCVDHNWHDHVRLAVVGTDS